MSFFGWGPQPAADHGTDLQLKGGEQHMLITYLQALLAQVRRDEEGQTAVEYGLVIALIALVIVGVLATAMTGVIANIVGQINDAL
jgi:Flp pilus assembly pilin Flp